MKITTNNMGSYSKVAGKELDGCMSLRMFDWIAGKLSGDAKTKEIGVLTPQHFYQFRQDNTFHDIEQEWDDRLLKHQLGE